MEIIPYAPMAKYEHFDEVLHLCSSFFRRENVFEKFSSIELVFVWLDFFLFVEEVLEGYNIILQQPL